MEEKEEQEVNKGLKLLVKSSFVIFIGIFLSKLFSYLYRIVIARHFGPEVYGLFSLAFIIIVFGVSISSMGIPDGLIRYIALYRAKKENKKIRYIIGLSYKLLIVPSIVFAILLFFLADVISINLFGNSNLIIFVKIFSLIIPFWVFANIFLSVIRAYERVCWYSFIFNILPNISKFAILIILVVLGVGSNSIIYSFIFGILLMLISSYLYFKFKISLKGNKKEISSSDKTIIKKSLLSYSWPIVFFSIIASIFYWIDSFFLGYFKGVINVGFYNVAAPIAAFLMLVPELFTQLFFPLITREYSRNNLGVIKELSKQIGKWIFTINVPLLIIILFFPGVIINILFGPKYLVAINALRFLSISVFISSILVVSNNLINMSGRSKIILMDIIIASTINIILNVILIQSPTIFGLDNSLGINGAALATMASIIIFNLLFFFQAKHYFGITPLRKKMIYVSLISLVLMLIILGIKSVIVIDRLSMILVGGLFLILYVFSIIIFKCLDKNDLMILRAIKDKIYRK